MTQPEPHERLDAAMSERRLELRLNWREVATMAGITYEALRGIRRGDYKPAELTARGLDDALQWVPGSVLAILQGGHPRPAVEVNTEAVQPDAAELPPLDEELSLAQRLLAATLREMRLSPEDADEVWRRVRLDIEATHRSQRGGTSHDDRNDRTG
ncbi:hypothetical protein QF032_001346 [Streptomyces achromogenes]|uniref:hypothetical protein n=1 Tax=Streptomyces achromogenes TaxID=67255 RepID=UPI002784F954|nr:hypothetical protein [Streptomyces achromogenes]MDQ0829502.1 hypothetical protein [Streptomyces achromogenes]